MASHWLAVAQMTSTSDVEQNFATCRRRAENARARAASLLVFPENFAFMGASDEETRRAAEPLDGPLFTRYRAIAKELGLPICFGGFPEKIDEQLHYNAHVLVDENGAIASVYRKIHLFDVALADGSRYRESACTAPGKEVVIADSAVGKLGLTICYDLRFPELYRALAERGAEVLLVPAAFTLTTGKEHWEALLRARAIENECYVAAAAQTGKHNEKRDTFGHAMIVDPWGTVIAQCRDGTGIALAEIDLDFLRTVRKRIPVWEHRRLDVIKP